MSFSLIPSIILTKSRLSLTEAAFRANKLVPIVSEIANARLVFPVPDPAENRICGIVVLFIFALSAKVRQTALAFSCPTISSNDGLNSSFMIKYPFYLRL